MSEFSRNLVNKLSRYVAIPVVGQMFIVPLIGLLKGKDHRIQRERKQRSVRYRIRQVVKYITMLCIVGAVLLFAFPSLFFGEDEEAAERLLIKEGKFGEVINEISDEKLVDYYRNFGSEPNDGLLNKVAKLRKRIRIANKLRESSDPDFQQQGVAFSLATNSDLALVYLGEGDPLNESIRKPLETQSKISSSQSSELDALSSLARSIIILADILHPRIIPYEESEPQIPSVDSLNAEFDQAAKLAKNEQTSARLLYQTAIVTEKKLDRDVAKSMYQSLVDHLQDSSQDSLRKLSSVCRNRILDVDIGMPKINLRGTKASQIEQVRAAKEKIYSISQSQDLTVKEWDYIIRSIHVILRMGHVNDAKELLNHCTELLDESTTKHQKLFALQKWVAEIGNNYAIEGLFDTYGNEINFRPKDRLCRVLVYADPDNSTQTKKAMEVIVNMASRSIQNLSTTVTTIYAKDGIGKTAEDDYLKTDLEFAKKSDYLNMWVIDTKSKSGAEHVLKYPVVEYPFVIVLDQEKRVALVNPNRFEFERHIVSILRLAKEKEQNTGE